LKDAIDGFLKQRPNEAVPGPDSDDMMLRTVGITGVTVGELAAAMPDAAAPLTAAAPTGPSALPPLNLAI
jgi:flagellum-specific ATP synthase